MSLSKPFILRPVATSLLMVALLQTGIMAYRLLPVAALPHGVESEQATRRKRSWA